MVKPLHLAKSLEDLVKMSEKVKLGNLNLKRSVEKMVLLHNFAKKSKLDKDEEEEFIYLHRYLNILGHASKFSDFTKEKYRDQYSCAQSNMETYEALREKLSSRYGEVKTKEKNDENVRLSMKTDSSPTQEKTLKDLTNHKTAGKLDKISISSDELYSLLNSKNNNKNKNDSCIIIDVRSATDFKESHLNTKNVINIPEEVIKPGITAATLSKALPQEIKEKWEKRGVVSNLIILDWNSSEHNLKQEVKLYHLREAMSKWDPRTSYKSPPLILEGGFEDILNKYPHITTNPKVVPPLPDNLKDSLSLDSFDYPMQVLEPEEEKKPKPILAVEPQTIKKADTNRFIVDRSTKPNLISEPTKRKVEEFDELKEKIETPVEEKKNIPEEISSPSTEDPSSINDDGSEQSVLEENTDSDKPGPNQMLNELRKVKPDIPGRPQSSEVISSTETTHLKVRHEQDKPEPKSILSKRQDEGTYRVSLKKEDGGSGGILKRASSSPNIAKLDDDGSLRTPTFTRANKPAVYAERTDSTYGQTAAGLTGLKNFANNCYMNSILQCLSNTHSLVKELISISKMLPINYHSKTKGRVAQEVISAFRNMWSGDIRVYSIKDLKTLLGGLKDIFKGNAHQDSNEFLIILLEYLHDDLNIPADIDSRLDGAREETGEKAWGEFRRKNCSIIQRLFYGQHRSTVTCSSCNHSSVTFEQFFNLFVPIPSKETVTLNECIQLYMSGEKISGWKCPKCKDERNATKKFDISRLPPILVIALKRFTHEEDSWLQKKENLVTYPLENLDMEKFTVKGSEQRYKQYSLYAMSTHTGTLRAGHYKAICKNSATHKWYMFDDQSVDALPLHSVQNNPEVYILFYNAILSNC